MSIVSVMPSKHLFLCHPLFFLPSIFPASGSFQMSQLSASGGQSIVVSASTSVPPVNTQDYLDSILKNRDITLPTKVCLVKAMVFPVVMYGCESWTIKKSECQRIDAFELWYWRRLLRVAWTARRSNQSILKEISPEYSLEGLMLKLKLQYFGHLMRRVDSFKRPKCWEGLGAGGEGDNRG